MFMGVLYVANIASKIGKIRFFGFYFDYFDTNQDKKVGKKTRIIHIGLAVGTIYRRGLLHCSFNLVGQCEGLKV